MKIICLFSALALGTLLITSCGKNCDDNNPSCSDIVPTNEPCFMLCTSWFYDSETNGCVETSYGCCNPVGFATQAECEECVCLEE